jgi:Arc/MetJ-type ribon-helix-helix transcriptional regulator
MLTASRAIHVPLSRVVPRSNVSLRCMTNCDTLLGVSSAISVRLDDEALRALAQLQATGLSRSEAIRRAILDSAARLQRRAALAAEVAALEADEDDRREMLEVAAMMESMRAAG